MNGNLELALSWFKVANEDLLAAEHSIDMVVICTPNGLHARQTIAC